MENHEKRFQFEVNGYNKIEIIGYVKTTMDSICGMHRHPFWELVYTIFAQMWCSWQPRPMTEPLQSI